jgi:hypothetical protein
MDQKLSDGDIRKVMGENVIRIFMGALPEKQLEPAV